ncbi:MAG: DUF3710 domain-containing protein [Actinomycetaceae bacterium]|nr:DUF3710 domain-containing protein [Actinomycetaceae bacterium]
MGLFRNRGGARHEGIDADFGQDDAASGRVTSGGVGPWDEAEAPEREEEMLDCGALRLPVIEGASIQFTVDRNRDIVLGAVYVLGDSALQIQVFAAPKSRGIWDDVRADMISSIAAQGGSSREEAGAYGQEIRAQMPIEGRRSINPVRYIGIDGARWLLRATVTGKAAVDDNAARTLLHLVLDHTVVVRGEAAHPPRDILPLNIPKKSGRTEDERPKLELPKRGPELSEVR